MRLLVRLLAVVVVLAPACGGRSDEPSRTIVFVQDLSAPDAQEHAQPALEAVELATAQAEADVELEVVDLAEDPDAVGELASDPTVIAAIVAPGADGAAIAEGGVPTLSVSTAGRIPARGAWRRLVAPMGAVADVVATRVGGGPACILSEEPAPDELATVLTERLGAPSAATAPEQIPAFVAEHGCEVVAWAGSPDAAVESVALVPAARFVGGDRLLDRDFRADVGPAGEGTEAACACIDVSTSLDPDVLRFIQDYQSEFGSAPGPYAVEAWDAARALVAALETGSDRASVAELVGSFSTLDGLVSRYVFGSAGELAEPAAAVGVFELRAGRWVAV